MKSLIDLWRESALELADWCHTSTTRDIKTVTRRVEDEGTSFLTITLPNYGKEFERALDRGLVDSNHFAAFRSKRGGLPMFLSGFLCQVFDEDSGAILPEPCIDSIFAIRFLTNLFKKIELPCSNSRTARTMQAWLDCEQEVGDWEDSAPAELISEFAEASQLLFADVLSRIDSKVYSYDVKPKHGPGSTADGLLGNQKFYQREWTTRLEAVFPYGEYCIPNWRYYYLLDHVDFLEPGAERPVRVIPVPKTLKAPRPIAIEPTCMQYMQQALRVPLVEELENPESFCFGFLGFTDQSLNRDMAREGSRTRSLATLDLSEASDRVPHLLVTAMLRHSPWLLAGVNACRSTRAEIPTLKLSVPRIRKFASMGSALCFPMEAMVFLAVVFIGISKSVGLPLSRQLVQSYRGKVRVYGDDIIVPTDCALSVIAALDRFGFRVNADKTFFRGNFRESCGGDYYDGEDVTPIRLKQAIPTSRADVAEVISLVEFRNHIYLRGMWKTARFLDDKITVLLGGLFPIVDESSPCLGRISFLPYQAERLDDDTHAPRVRAWVPRAVIGGNSVDNEFALVKCLLSSVLQEDVKHLERSGRPSYVTLKRRWVSPY